MYRKINDFLSDWKEEAELTLSILSAISEGKKGEKIHEEIRTLERLAWHITQTVTEMLFRAGLFADDFLAQNPIPESFKQITEVYRMYAHELAIAVEESWTDRDLETEVEMYGEKWTKGRVLSVLVKHQAHHRGQMTVIMRLMDMKVPGTYGPSKEEWTRYGMVPMD